MRYKNLPLSRLSQEWILYMGNSSFDVGGRSIVRDKAKNKRDGQILTTTVANGDMPVEYYPKKNRNYYGFKYTNNTGTGVDNNINLGSFTITIPFTIYLSLKRRDNAGYLGDDPIISFSDGANVGFALLIGQKGGANPDQLWSYVNGGAPVSVYSAGTIAYDVIYEIYVAITAANTKFYINGVLDNNAAQGGKPANYAFTNSIGQWIRFGTNIDFTNIYECGIIERELSAQEINREYYKSISYRYQRGII